MRNKNCVQYLVKEYGMFEKNLVEGNIVFVYNDKKGIEDLGDLYFQWQFNFFIYIENVQNEVISRMDLIEKEVDVLESWFDFIGELELLDFFVRLF